MTKEEKIKSKIKDTILKGMNWTGFNDIDSTVNEIYHLKLSTDEESDGVRLPDVPVCEYGSDEITLCDCGLGHAKCKKQTER